MFLILVLFNALSMAKCNYLKESRVLSCIEYFNLSINMRTSVCINLI